MYTLGSVSSVTVINLKYVHKDFGDNTFTTYSRQLSSVVLV